MSDNKNKLEQQIHSEFWKEFVEQVFNDSNFKNNFNYREPLNRSYYDLSWENKDIHLCLRHNVRENYVAVEIYVEEDERIFNYLLENKNTLEGLYGKNLKFTKARGKVGKARKIYDTYICGETCDRSAWSNYIQWIKITALKMKEIVEIFYGRLDSQNKNSENPKKIDFSEWIIPCNVAYYDVIGAFNELRSVEWKQSVNIKVNDIVYIYVGSPYKEIKYKCIARKVNLDSAGRIDDSKFIIDGSAYENNGRYMELELLKKYGEQELSLNLLREKGIKAVQGPSRITKELSSYIALLGKGVEYEREVISIPTAETINLIYKYGIHAHPNDKRRYPYKKSLFYTFREKNGIMTKLYELNTTIILNPQESSAVDSLDIDIFIKERLKNYINERENKFSFDDKESEYKFYILNNPIELVNEIALPNQNNQSYFTIEEVFSGKRYVDRCNYKTNNTREDLIKIIKDKSKVDYLEINVEDFDSNIEIEEGKTITKLVEVKKRNSLARKLKLEEFKSINGKLYCEVCGIDDEIVLDVHHDKVSVADMEEGHITKLDDLRVICANCHRKVHGLKVTVDRLIEINDGINFK